MSLVEAGADVNAVNNGGWMPLHYAMRGGEGCNDPALVEWLVRRGGLLEFGISSDSRTPSPQLAHGAQHRTQPLSSQLSDLFPHPAALSPTAHHMFQG